jgi:putative ABC transport system substrate-binding protein
MSLTVGLAVVALGVAGCSSSSDKDSSGDGAATDASAAAGGSDKEFKIGISQIVEHPSLDLIAKGFQDELTAQGVKFTIDAKNAEGESSNAAVIASAFAADSSIDLVLAIATPTAQAAVQQVKDRPVLFAGVTDPVAAQLVPGEGASGTNVTGTSDLNPEAKPVELIKQIIPDVKTIGVLYSSAETNSQIQFEAYEKEAEPLGITMKAQTIAQSSEVATGVEALKGVDAILIPTDNTVVSALDVVIKFCETNKVPLFTADAESVEKGTIATRGISYEQLGHRTGEMAKQILVEGKDAGEIPWLVVTDTDLKVNTKAAELMGVTIPEAILAEATDVATQ